MADYWKSTPKYWCKHCETFVVDTPLGRKNHDATSKHQHALQRFLRDLHRSNERAQAASDSAKREVARLNALVGGGASSSSSAAPARPAPSVAKPELKKGERWGVSAQPVTEEVRRRQMAELAALGVALPEQARKEVAMPGEWEVVSVARGETEAERAAREELEERRRALEEEERKRKFDELDQDEREVRGFKLRTREFPGEEEEGEVAALFKKLKKGKGLELGPGVKREVKEEPGVDGGRVKLEFGKRREGVKEPKALRDGEEVKEEEGGAEVKPDPNAPQEEAPAAGEAETPVKKEEVSPPPAEDAPAAPPAETPSGGGVVFKKRKAKNIRQK